MSHNQFTGNLLFVEEINARVGLLGKMMSRFLRVIMKKIKYGLLLLVATYVVPGHAAGPGWTAISEVVELVTTHDGGINVRLNPELSGCVSNSGYGAAFASIYPSHAGIDKIHANLLAAMMAGKKVRLWFADDKCKAMEMRIYK